MCAKSCADIPNDFSDEGIGSDAHFPLVLLATNFGRWWGHHCSSGVCQVRRLFSELSWMLGQTMWYSSSAIALLSRNLQTDIILLTLNNHTSYVYPKIGLLDAINELTWPDQHIIASVRAPSVDVEAFAFVFFSWVHECQWFGPPSTWKQATIMWVRVNWWQQGTWSTHTHTHTLHTLLRKIGSSGGPRPAQACPYYPMLTLTNIRSYILAWMFVLMHVGLSLLPPFP